jgi:hypothetical protein
MYSFSRRLEIGRFLGDFEAFLLLPNRELTSEGREESERSQSFGVVAAWKSRACLSQLQSNEHPNARR